MTLNTSDTSRALPHSLMCTSQSVFVHQRASMAGGREDEKASHTILCCVWISFDAWPCAARLRLPMDPVCILGCIGPKLCKVHAGKMRAGAGTFWRDVSLPQDCSGVRCLLGCKARRRSAKCHLVWRHIFRAAALAHLPLCAVFPSIPRAHFREWVHQLISLSFL